MRDFIIRVFCALIPFKKLRKKTRYRLLNSGNNAKIQRKLDSIQAATVDPNGMGMLNLMLDNARVLDRHRHMFQKMKKDDVCLDCGANVGIVTDIFRFMDARVYSFEPHPDLFTFLEQKYSEDKKVTLINKAVWDKDDELSFQIPKNDTHYLSRSITSTLFNNSRLNDDCTHVKVPVIDLTEYIQNEIFKHCDEVYLLKIDIEGAEFELIEKIIETEIYKKIKFIVCETHARIIKDGKTRLKEIEHLIEHHKIDNIFLDWV